jgi:hypothetical protein
MQSGVTIEQISAALGELTTARASHELLIGDREVPVRGDGLTDFSRNINSVILVVKDRRLEHLNVGPDTFHKLNPGRAAADRQALALGVALPFW